MTDASIARPVEADSTVRPALRRLVSTDWYLPVCSALLVVALWLVSRPYVGIIHDSRIYLGRALADLDPSGLGQQIDYAHDGQGGFTVFPRIVAAITQAIGPSSAMMLLAAFGLGAWLAAAWWLLSRFFRGAVLLGALICLCGFPAVYGGYNVFRWAEEFATPRIFAEAGGLCALALLTDGRRLASIAFLLVASAFHPLMALPVAMVGFVVLVFEDRRWLALAPAGAAGILVPAWLHAPLFARLFEAFDRSWLDIVVARGPYLFPDRWSDAAWALLSCQLVTIALALRVVGSPLRRMLIGSALAGVVGVMASVLAPTVLIVQLQVWRSLWLVSFFAAATFAPVAAELWKRGGSRSISLGLLVLAWMTRDLPVVSLPACAVAIGASFAPSPEGSIQRVLVSSIWLLAAIATAGWLAIKATALINVFGSAPPGNSPSFAQSIDPILALAAPLFGVLVVGGKLSCSRVWARAIYGLAAVVACLAALLIWDQRSVGQKLADEGAGGQELRSIIHSGTVLWLDDSGMDWLRTGRPYWWSDLEGAETVFDRDLSMEWYQRLERLMSVGLVSSQDGVFTDNPRARPEVRVTSNGATQLCAAKDRPDWLIAPTTNVDASFLPAARYVWRPPRSVFKRTADLRGWKVLRDFAVFSCVDLENRAA